MIIWTPLHWTKFNWFDGELAEFWALSSINSGILNVAVPTSCGVLDYPIKHHEIVKSSLKYLNPPINGEIGWFKY